MRQQKFIETNFIQIQNEFPHKYEIVIMKNVINCTEVNSSLHTYWDI